MVTPGAAAAYVRMHGVRRPERPVVLPKFEIAFEPQWEDRDMAVAFLLLDGLDPRFPADAWLQGLRIFSPDAVAVHLPRHRVQDLDTPEDWTRAEWLWRAMQADGATP